VGLLRSKPATGRSDGGAASPPNPNLCGYKLGGGVGGQGPNQPGQGWTSLQGGIPSHPPFLFPGLRVHSPENFEKSGLEGC
jgi:hypothetical protein